MTFYQLLAHEMVADRERDAKEAARIRGLLPCGALVDPSRRPDNAAGLNVPDLTRTKCRGFKIGGNSNAQGSL